MLSKKYLLCLNIIFIFILMIGISVSSQELKKAETPLLITSAGQSPDFNVITVLCKRYKIEETSKGLAEAEDIEDFKSIIFVLGGSTKGLGAAGIDEDGELKRIVSLLDKAEKENMFIIGIHIGGEGRRGPLSMKFIEPVSSRCDCLIVSKDGNADGYFTDIGKEHEILTFIVDKPLEIGPILLELFKNE